MPRAADAASGGSRAEPVLDPRRRRILFRATHRGTQETDKLIGGFVAPRIDVFSAAELDALEEIMELPDADLADWLMGRRPIPSEHDTPMMRAIDAAAAGLHRRSPGTEPAPRGDA
ncbi:succinate dehydrogenase assembly factor 2 [Rhizosaccharibacter radicis]|uniref:FAD assembly factor SdhE n=1 Tax=Rhizosaccharibacter radicis TaxID=2782605 RepID=A0ABT1VWW0_9PROT|nr:succinate dehydrogenase assembly factor 2 [Acetobacteraceae bacterium KSS12]